MRVNIRSFLFSQIKTHILLTGIQPTGQLHIGNYLGSVINMLKLQQDSNFHQKYLMIADYHSLTTHFTYDHAKIYYKHNIGQNSFQMAKLLIAAGIDLSKMCLFIQSQVPAHCQLAWIFSCLGPQHWLNTMIQYKQKYHENSSVGLYTYPILMAVDILLYRANHVPVGVDQLQHIELTNKYSQRFNKLFKTTFFPKVKYVQAQFPKVMSLVDPVKKMSKSDSNLRSRIILTDKPQTIRDKIRRAVTDSDGNNITFDEAKRPGLANLIRIYSAFTENSIEAVCQQMTKNNRGIAQFKQMLSEVIAKRLKEIQDRQLQLTDEQVRKAISLGAQKAKQVADKNLKQVKMILSIYA